MSSGSMPPPCSAGPLPPPSYRGSDFNSFAPEACQQQPTGNHLGFGLGLGYSRYTGTTMFDTPERGFSFGHGDNQLFPGSDPHFGSASFSPCFGTALGQSLAMHFGELSMTTPMCR